MHLRGAGQPQHPHRRRALRGLPPQQARRILARADFHSTPKHGSWLNQAEIEISIVERGCLSRPVPDRATLERRVRALEAERNAQRATIEWQFTNKQARVKFKKLYPVVPPPV